MSLRTLSVKAFLFLGLCQVGRRGLASAPELTEQPKKIAVVGAGIGGTAAAYFLRQEFGPAVRIAVYEAGTVGGRLATENIGGYEYESGGSVIHPLNLHMKHFVDKLDSRNRFQVHKCPVSGSSPNTGVVVHGWGAGLSQRADVPSRMAIFDGKELTFEESEWFIVNVLRMLWRYGLNFLRMHLWVESILDKFMRIYQYQQFGHCFTSVERLLHAMGGDSFLTLLNNTLEETMLANGFSQAFINDIVTPITRVNYGQSVRLPGFVGAVSLAGADSGLWAVDGGNKRVCSGLLYHSKAELIPARVTAVSVKTRPAKHGAVATFYEVNYVGESGPAHSLYDIVIVATPLHQDLSDISFSGISPPISSHFPGRYHQTVATLVLGQLNVSYLGTEQKPSDFTFSDILTTDSKALAINSLSSLDPAHMPPNYRQQPASQTKVWKVFSHGPLSELQLQELFLSREQVRERRWLAYPHYRTPQRRIPPFILHDRLFYLSAIDWAASAMEMSAIAARNTALLAHHRWYSQTDKVDQEDLHTRLRGEL